VSNPSINQRWDFWASSFVLENYFPYAPTHITVFAELKSFFIQHDFCDIKLGILCADNAAAPVFCVIEQKFRTCNRVNRLVQQPASGLFHAGTPSL